jgi:hypothetical protein
MNLSECGQENCRRARELTDIAPATQANTICTDNVAR